MVSFQNLSVKFLRWKMKDKHESEVLNKLLNKRVRIEFNDGKIKIGILKQHKFGFGYFLEIPQGTLSFVKSHVKKIGEA